jgi:hypothetical protein
MGSQTVLRDVGETLKTLVKKRIPELADENRITFDSPADLDPSPNARLSIFLYQITHNIYLRNCEPEPVGRDKMQAPPLALDLFYLFTPYAPNRETELIILENLMQFFYAQEVLKGEMLQGKLIECGNNEIRVVPHSFSFEEINKLWERFPNKPFKLSVSYMLTPLKVPSELAPYPITRVSEKVINVSRIGDSK